MSAVWMALAADDEVVGPAELGVDAVEGGVHGALVFGGGEVGEGLVGKGCEGRVSHPYSHAEPSPVLEMACAEGLRLRLQDRFQCRFNAKPVENCREFFW